MSENLVFFLPSTSFDACSSDVSNAVPLTELTQLTFNVISVHFGNGKYEEITSM